MNSRLRGPNIDGEQLYASFRWDIPARYNIAADVCDRHATDPGKIALIGEGPDGKVWQMTFRDVQRKANKLANFLLSIGLVKGDRVMLLLGQNPWTAIGHVACWKAGLVSVPVSVLFAADAVAFRLGHVAARVVITDLANQPTAVRAREQATEAVRIFVIDGREPEAESLPDAIEPARDAFTNVDTAADDPAFSISRPAPPAIPRERCRRTGRCLGICRERNSVSISFRSRTI
jgi:acetyl-CoA synthetase